MMESYQYHINYAFDSSQIHETIETINQLKTQREFMLSFARDPQGFINDWLQSQCRDLKVSPSVMTSHWNLKELPSEVKHTTVTMWLIAVTANFQSSLNILFYLFILNMGKF